MSLMTHRSMWRLLVGAAPIVGAAFFGWAAAQGEADLARSPAARAILAAVAALGTVVTWWTARQLRAAAAAAAALPIARAAAQAQWGQSAGIVALQGRARALPEAVPLVSPGGELCLWFRTGDHAPHRESVRPFLLVDDSGECVVLPAGADVTGPGLLPGPPVRPRRSGARERTPEYLLRADDPLRVTGRLVAASPQGLPPPAPQGLLLPTIAAPAPGEPLRMRIGPEAGEGGVFGLLALADCLVLLVSSSLTALSMFEPH